MAAARTAVGGGARARRAGGAADVDSYLGMIIFLGAWVMLFAALFFAYGVVRVQAESWPPPGEAPLPRGAPGLSTLVLLASSVALRRARTAARDGQARAFARALGAAIALGALFVGAQAAIWRAMLARGLLPSSGIYGSVFFAFTAFHALHVACGLVALVAVAIRAARARRRADGRAAAGLARALRVTALYWHFMAAIWVLMYVTIFLV